MILIRSNSEVNNYNFFLYFSPSLVLGVGKEASNKSGDNPIRPPGQKRKRRNGGGEPPNVVPKHRRCSRRPEPSSSGGNRKSSRRPGKRNPKQSLVERPSDQPSEKRRPGRPEGCGISEHRATEGYREEKIPLGLFEKVNFMKNPKKAAEAAKLIVEDMTERLNLGLVIPPNAKFSYNGQWTSSPMEFHFIWWIIFFQMLVNFIIMQSFIYVFKIEKNSFGFFLLF